jgi:hypothetical protein
VPEQAKPVLPEQLRASLRRKEMFFLRSYGTTSQPSLALLAPG